MANSVDPDGTARDEPSHLDLHCLQNYLFLVCGTEKVKFFAQWEMQFNFRVFVFSAAQVFLKQSFSGIIQHIHKQTKAYVQPKYI